MFVASACSLCWVQSHNTAPHSILHSIRVQSRLAPSPSSAASFCHWHADLNRWPVIGLTSIPNLSISKLNMLEQGMQIRIDCGEWAVNIQRDSYASYVGHYPILAYFAIAENESIGRERYNFMQVHFLFSFSPLNELR
ncbi:Splicing factor 3B subunit 5/RDS3 complex subunit 10 [Senna tora]|uniref:Splicing factor 3B subunit 5/RDS3 complex subunit 10 n=1 Tax=Senna tora TaxID=362788 RepID=A0A834TM29_9FABA|nr:Splicing factor 3B subunit 5/RDS3 complex subunit 10 [Senna tora]